MQEYTDAFGHAYLVDEATGQSTPSSSSDRRGSNTKQRSRTPSTRSPRSPAVSFNGRLRRNQSDGARRDVALPLHLANQSKESLLLSADMPRSRSAKRQSASPRTKQQQTYNMAAVDIDQQGRELRELHMQRLGQLRELLSSASSKQEELPSSSRWHHRSSSETLRAALGNFSATVRTSSQPPGPMLQVDAEACVAVGGGLKASVVHVPSFVTLQARQADGVALRRSPGTGFKVQLSGPAKANTLVHDNQDGTALLCYTCTVSGSYRLEVRQGGTHIHGSPFTIRVGNGAVKPANCIMDGDGLHSAAAGAYSEFTIVAMDEDGNRRLEGGEMFAVDLIHGERSIAVDYSVQDRENGTYAIRYMATVAGTHQLHITLGEMELAGSPCAVQVHPSPCHMPHCLVNDGAGHSAGTAGEQQSFLWSPRDRFRNNLIRGGLDCRLMFNLRETFTDGMPDLGDPDLRVEDHNDGTYTFRYKAHVAGKYSFQILCHEEDTSSEHNSGGSRSPLRRSVSHAWSHSEYYPLTITPGETTGVACYLKAVNPAVIVDSAAAKPTKPAAVKAAVKGGPSSKGRPAPLSPSHIIMERSNDPPSLRPFTERGRVDVTASWETDLIMQAADKCGNHTGFGGHDVSVWVADSSDAYMLSKATQVVDNGDGTYEVKIQAHQVGVFNLHLVIDGVESEHSPIALTVHANVTDFNNCDISFDTMSLYEGDVPDETAPLGPGFIDCADEPFAGRGQCGHDHHIKIIARDCCGNRKTVGGDLVSIEMGLLMPGSSSPRSPRTATNFSIPVVDMKDGSYEGTFSISTIGRYHATFMLKQRKLASREFRSLFFAAGPVDLANCFATGDGIHHAVVGRPASFTVTIRDSFRNNVPDVASELRITVSGACRVQVHREEGPVGVYKCNYTASIAGVYIVSVLYDGQHIQGSQFSASVVANSAIPAGLIQPSNDLPSSSRLARKSVSGGNRTVVAQTQGQQPLHAKVWDASLKTTI